MIIPLGQLNDCTNEVVSYLASLGDVGCFKIDMGMVLFHAFQKCGYHTLKLPWRMDFEKLSYHAHLLKLPNDCHHENAIQ